MCIVQSVSRTCSWLINGFSWSRCPYSLKRHKLTKMMLGLRPRAERTLHYAALLSALVGSYYAKERGALFASCSPVRGTLPKTCRWYVYWCNQRCKSLRCTFVANLTPFRRVRPSNCTQAFCSLTSFPTFPASVCSFFSLYVSLVLRGRVVEWFQVGLDLWTKTSNT